MENLKAEMVAPFGPVIYKGKFEDKYIDEMLNKTEEARNNKQLDASQYLVGRIKEQYEISSIVSEDCVGHLYNHCANYWWNYTGQNAPDNSLYLESLWVNVQRPYEFNPVHQHGGAFSFIIYLKNTISYEDVVDNEYDKNQHQKIAGQVEFLYGEYNFMNADTFRHNPQQGDILIFPAWLKHTAYPFYKENEERLSVAGNFYFNLGGQNVDVHDPNFNSADIKTENFTYETK